MATEDETHERNSYFQGFDDIVKALDALVKTVTPSEDDDGETPDPGARPCCNSYFTSFGNVKDALERLKSATEERLEALTEKDPNFTEWKDGAYSINIGANSKTISNSIAIGASAACGAATGSHARDTGAVAIGRVAQAYGHCATALGKGARVGADGNRTTLPTVQLGAGANENDGTLQFRDWQVVDATGKIPAERLPDTTGALVLATPTITGGTVTLTDRAVNVVHLGGGTVSFAFPPSSDGYARSFMIRIAMDAETEWSVPASATVMCDDEDVFDPVDAGTSSLFIFSEMEPNVFLVSRKNISTVKEGNGIRLCKYGDNDDNIIDFTDRTTPIVFTGKGLMMSPGDTIKFDLCPGKGASISTLDELEVVNSTDTEIRVFNYRNSSSQPDGGWWGKDVRVTVNIGGETYTYWVKFKQH